MTTGVGNLDPEGPNPILAAAGLLLLDVDRPVENACNVRHGTAGRQQILHFNVSMRTYCGVFRIDIR